MKSGIVSIVGRPNSGKSTLLNALVGQHVSIVSDKPQTTRNRILAVRNDASGQIAFADTPGIHRPAFRMNERMQRTVRDALVGVDLLLHVIDASISFGAGEQYALDVVKASGLRAVLVLNKVDRVKKPALLPRIDRYSRAHDYAEIVPVSALSGENLPLLVERVYENLPDGEPLYDHGYLTDRTERFMAGEIVREKILARTREEIPYATAVLVRSFDESARGRRRLVRIEADLIVERRSQQGIILGAGARQLCDIGTAARKDLEPLLGCRVFLGLTVKTVPRWRNSDRVLDELGVGT
jgi:GTP-binding protein Era